MHLSQKLFCSEQQFYYFIFCIFQSLASFWLFCIIWPTLSCVINTQYIFLYLIKSIDFGFIFGIVQWLAILFFEDPFLTF